MRKKRKTVQCRNGIKFNPNLVISNNMAQETIRYLDKLVGEYKVLPSQILVLCPTGLGKRADLKEVVDHLKFYDSMAKIDSFHSLGYRIIETFNCKTGKMNTVPFVKYPVCRMRDFKTAMLDNGISLDHQEVKSLLDNIERAKSFLIYPDEVRRANNFIRLYKRFINSPWEKVTILPTW